MPTNDTGQIPPGPGPLIRPMNSPGPAERYQPGLMWGGLLALVLWGPAAAALAAPPVEAPRPPAGSQTAESSRRAVPGLLWQLRLSRPADAPQPGSDEVESSGQIAAAQQVAPEQLVTTSHLSTDGCLLAVGTAAGNVFLIETASGHLRDSRLSVRTVPLRQLPLPPGVEPESAPASQSPAAGTTVRQVQFDRDQPGLLHVLSDRAILRWNTARPQPELVAVIPVPLVAPAERIDSDLRIARLLSADGRQVVITGGNAPQLVLSGSQLESQREIAEPIEIDDCQTLPGTDALFASRFGRLYRWNLQSGERAWKTRLEARIRGFAFDAPGTRIVALADYVGFQLVDPLTGNVLGQLPDPERRAGSGGESMAIAVSPDGTFFVRGAADGSLELWDHITGLRLYRLSGHSTPIEHVRFLAEGGQLLSIGHDGTVLCHDLFSADFFLNTAPAAQAESSPAASNAADAARRPEALPAAAGSATTSQAGQYWESLGSPDGQTACGAALVLAADPRLAVSLIENPPSPVPEIRRLIAQLGSPLFVRRREAYRRLRELALTAEEELQQVAGSTGSVEVASRIRRLLDRLQGPSRNAQRELRQLSRQRQSLLTVRVLQWAGTPAARTLLERIADGKQPGSEAAAGDARRALSWLDQSASQREDAQQPSGCSEESASAAPASTTD